MGGVVPPETAQRAQHESMCQKIEENRMKKQATVEAKFFQNVERHTVAAKTRDENLGALVTQYSKVASNRLTSHSSRYSRILKDLDEKKPDPRTAASSAPGSPTFSQGSPTKSKLDSTSLSKSLSDSRLCEFLDRLSNHTHVVATNRERNKRAHKYMVT